MSELSIYKFGLKFYSTIVKSSHITRRQCISSGNSRSHQHFNCLTKFMRALPKTHAPVITKIQTVIGTNHLPIFYFSSQILFPFICEAPLVARGNEA